MTTAIKFDADAARNDSQCDQCTTGVGRWITSDGRAVRRLCDTHAKQWAKRAKVRMPEVVK